MHFVFGLILNLLLISVGIAAVSFAPWVPMRRKDVARVVRLANLKRGEVFYDLGCGDGRTVFAVAKQTEAVAIGIELAFPLYLFCLIRKWLTRSRAQFMWRNLFKVSMAKADVIYVFGMPKTLAKKFKDKVERECKPGTRILSYVFMVEGWTPVNKDRPTDKDSSIYTYVIF